MLFRRCFVGALAMAAAVPAYAHGPTPCGGRPGDPAKVTRTIGSWTFARTANLEFACNIPGHYEDGMMGPIRFGK
jgi:hypothetical protein